LSLDLLLFKEKDKRMLHKELNVQVSDTTGDAIGTAARYIINIFLITPFFNSFNTTDIRNTKG
jgi:hypothetical protein